MTKATVIVINKLGIHARPAGNFVRVVKQFSSQITMRVDGKDYPCKSIIKVLQAVVKQGTEIELTAVGTDEQQAIDALVEAVRGGLGDEL